MTPVFRRSLAAVLATAFAVTGMAAQSATLAAPSTDAAAARVPFGVGERFEYDIRFSKIHVGTGDMEVLPMDTVRGHATWHTVFHIKGGTLFYHVDDTYEDWFDVRSLASLRAWQDISEGHYNPKRRFEIFPERREYVEAGKDGPKPSVDRPLADGSFAYFVRTVPLRIGLDTSFNDYFKADRNPVRIRVIRRDTIEVPAGKFAAIIVEPVINTTGMFREGGEAQIWLSDDDNRIVLQLKSKLSFGSLNLYLKSYRPSPTTTAPLNRLSKPGTR